MIRVSTSELYQSAVAGISSQQSQINKDYQELSTGKSIANPADAPVAASRIVGVDAAMSQISAWSNNSTTASQTLSYASAQVQSVTTLVSQVRTLALQMANSTMSPQDRLDGASTVASYLRQLVGYANAQGPNGQYLFSGTKVATEPFSSSGSQGSTVNYYGDSGQKSLPVSASESVPVTISGSHLFMDIPNGNGSFNVTPVSTNTGTATVSGSITNTSVASSYLQSQGDGYRLTFSRGSNGLNYTVTRGKGAVGSSTWTASATTVTSGSYSAGNSIQFDGISLSLSGTPAAGDAFNVSPSKNQSLFTTVQSLQKALSSASSSPGQRAQNLQSINNVLQSLDQAQTRLGAVQADIGARIQDSQTANQANQSVQTQLTQLKSNLSNANLPTVITHLDQATLALQASAKAFVTIQGLSLFNYIS